jgi:hypothetical protein
MRKTVLLAPANDYAGNMNALHIAALMAPPLGALAVGTYLQRHGVPVEVIDVPVDYGFGLTPAADREVARRVAGDLQARVDEIAWVGISQLSNSGSGITLAEEIHASMPSVPLLFGGYFPSTAFETLLHRYPFITAIARGDGEVPALQFSRAVADEGQVRLSRIPNMAWRENGSVRATSIKPVELAHLPTIDFRLLRNPSSYQIIDLLTSRGCPFACSYCLEGGMRPYAVQTPEWVDGQLSDLATVLPNERVFVYDPVFGLGRPRTLALCRVLAAQPFSYAIESRVDVLTPDLVPELRSAHIEAIFLGIESASPSSLVRMNKVPSVARARAYVARAVQVLEACFENGITPALGLMLAFPGDTEDDYRATLQFVEQVGQLHERVAARTGIAPGFLPFAFFTKVYDGSPLSDQVSCRFPDARLRAELFLGERTVVAPSPGLEPAITEHYQERIAESGAFTPLALDRLRHYFVFSLAPFLASHPELTDCQNVVKLGSSLRVFSEDVTLTSMAMHYDKSKA